MLPSDAALRWPGNKTQSGIKSHGSKGSAGGRPRRWNRNTPETSMKPTAAAPLFHRLVR